MAKSTAPARVLTSIWVDVLDVVVDGLRRDAERSPVSFIERHGQSRSTRSRVRSDLAGTLRLAATACPAAARIASA